MKYVFDILGLSSLFLLMVSLFTAIAVAEFLIQ